MFKLDGKKALVTGATGGIGSEIAKTLYAQGAQVIVSGTREEKLNDLVKEIGNNCYKIACPLDNITDVESLINDAVNLIGGIDILVCNAGITKDALAIRMTREDFETVLNVNLTSTFILNRNAMKLMMKARWGRIINISSVVGFSGNPGQANYCASKAGMVGMTKALASEVASRGVTINNVAPGFISSPMTDVLNEGQKAKILSSIPTGNMGSAKDIASAVAFLATQEASYITGQTLHVNGGMLMI
jgi:3-oxoacyl-[acyl-carrier protein] reductase